MGLASRHWLAQQMEHTTEYITACGKESVLFKRIASLGASVSSRHSASNVLEVKCVSNVEDMPISQEPLTMLCKYYMSQVSLIL